MDSIGLFVQKIMHPVRIVSSHNISRVDEPHEDRLDQGQIFGESSWILQGDSINQSINQWAKQAISDRITHSNNQSINQSPELALYKSINQSINQSTIPAFKDWITIQSNNQALDQSLELALCKSINQWIDWSQYKFQAKTRAAKFLQAYTNLQRIMSHFVNFIIPLRVILIRDIEAVNFQTDGDEFRVVFDGL